MTDKKLDALAKELMEDINSNDWKIRPTWAGVSRAIMKFYTPNPEISNPDDPDEGISVAKVFADMYIKLSLYTEGERT